MIVFNEVSKLYDSVAALADFSIEIDNGEFIFLVGPSGAGKSTLLKLIIREEFPSRGEVFVDGEEVSKIPSSQVPHLRRKVGTIFQDFKLLPQRTVAENVAFPLEILGLPDDEIEKTTLEILKLVSLDDKAGSFPSQLSGGEAQRTAIARAMVLRPEIILADEPTGNLDSGSAWEVMQLLAKLNSLGTTVVMATHNIDISSSLPNRKIELQSGRLVKDSKQKSKVASKKEKEK
jgi:cell division transport system ATP-binding protein